MQCLSNSLNHKCPNLLHWEPDLARWKRVRAENSLKNYQLTIVRNGIFLISYCQTSFSPKWLCISCLKTSYIYCWWDRISILFHIIWRWVLHRIRKLKNPEQMLNEETDQNAATQGKLDTYRDKNWLVQGWRCWRGFLVTAAVKTSEGRSKTPAGG